MRENLLNGLSKRQERRHWQPTGIADSVHASGLIVSDYCCTTRLPGVNVCCGVAFHGTTACAITCQVMHHMMTAVGIQMACVCENRVGWLVAWGLCGRMLIRFSAVWLLPFTLL